MPNVILKYKLTALIILVLALNLKAQVIYDTLLLTEFEVISNLVDLNSPTKVITIDSIARKELNLNDIGELLASYTPVFVKSYGKGSLSTVSFRGTGASHTKVLWEGLNINSPMLGQTDFSLLPGSFFDEIELHYGGGSLTTVSGALGGSISLKNNSSNNNKHWLNVKQSVGSFNTYLTAATLVINKSDFSSDTRLMRQSSLNNFTYYNNALLPTGEEMTQSNSNFANIGFTQQFSYKISNNQEITFISWNQWNNRNIPAIMTNIEKGGNQKEYQNDFFSRNIIGWTLNNSKTYWEAKGAYFYEDIDYYLSTSDSLENTISLIDSKNKTENYSFTGNVSSVLIESLILKAGVELLQQIVISNNYSGKKQRTLFNSYISIKKNFKNLITVEALIRSEIVDAEFIPLTPMLAINLKPFTDHDFHLRLNLSKNHNIPTLNDLYWYPGGNEKLKPEQSLEADLSVDYIKNLNNKYIITLSASAYASSVSNWIIWLPGDYRYWSPENIASVYARGTELSIRFSGNYGKLKYNLFGEYAYTRTTDNSKKSNANDNSDTQLMYVPKHTASGYLNINIMGYFANWSLTYTGSRNTSLNNDENYSFTLPQYLLNNISVGKNFAIKKVDLEIRIKAYNIFDIDYQAVLWRAMPGRNYEISLSCGLK